MGKNTSKEIQASSTAAAPQRSILKISSSEDLKQLLEPRPPTPRAVAYALANTVEFIPPFVEGQVVKVYDGDTFTIASLLPHYEDSPVYRVHIRMLGIDSPELKSTNVGEKRIAKDAQTALSNLILGKWVKLRDTGNDKYGRLLANVYLGNLHVNQWMLDNDWAVEYDGGTKNIPEDWDAYRRERKRVRKLLAQ